MCSAGDYSNKCLVRTWDFFIPVMISGESFMLISGMFGIGFKNNFPLAMWEG